MGYGELKEQGMWRFENFEILKKVARKRVVVERRMEKYKI